MNPFTPIFYLILFIYGIVIGSFTNVCIIRIPRHESIVVVRSHCMTCGYQLKWYDLVPLFSWIFLGGKCRKCGEKISAQYPLLEALNGILYVFVGVVYGFSIETVLFCLLTSALVTLSMIDWRTFEIPVSINYFIFALGVIHIIIDRSHWMNYVIGFFAVSGFLCIVDWITKGRGIGGGDIKLMAAAGFLIGWKLILLAFLTGCILGSIIHLLRMKFTHADHVLALGPYLSAGIYLSLLFGNPLINWYLSSWTIN